MSKGKYRMVSEFEQRILDQFKELRDFVQSHCRDEEINGSKQLEKLESIERNQKIFVADVQAIKKTVIEVNTRLKQEESETQKIYKMIGFIKERLTRVETLIGLNPNTLIGIFNTKTILFIAVAIVIISSFFFGVINDTNVGGMLDKTLDKLP